MPMSEYTIQIEDGIAQLLEDGVCPEHIEPEAWLALQCEQAVTQAHIEDRRRELSPGRAN